MELLFFDYNIVRRSKIYHISAEEVMCDMYLKHILPLQPTTSIHTEYTCVYVHTNKKNI